MTVSKTIPTQGDLRTALASQRTFLSFVRTGFVMVGISMLIKDNVVLIAGLVTMIVGLVQHLITRYYAYRDQVVDERVLLASTCIVVAVGMTTVFIYKKKKDRGLESNTKQKEAQIDPGD